MPMTRPPERAARIKGSPAGAACRYQAALQAYERNGAPGCSSSTRLSQIEARVSRSVTATLSAASCVVIMTDAPWRGGAASGRACPSYGPASAGIVDMLNLDFLLPLRGILAKASH